MVKSCFYGFFLLLLFGTFIFEYIFFFSNTTISSTIVSSSSLLLSFFSNPSSLKEQQQKSKKSIQKKVKVIRFFGGGIYFWWQAGVARYLLDNTNLLNDSSIELVGYSSGSIAISLMLADIDFHHAAQVAIDQIEKYGVWEKPSGLFGIWGAILENFLQDLLLPSNLNTTHFHRLHIAMTPLVPSFSSSFFSSSWKILQKEIHYLNNFQSTEELIHAILTSTHIPLFMNGKFFRQFNGKYYVDGSIWPALMKVKPEIPETLYQKHQTLTVSSSFSPASSISSSSTDLITGKDEESPTALFTDGQSVNLEQTELDPREEFFALEDFNPVIEESASTVLMSGTPAINQDEIRALHRDEIEFISYDVEYKKDEKLMKYAESIHFVKLISPEMLYEMIELGYQYMKSEYESGRIPRELFQIKN